MGTRTAYPYGVPLRTAFILAILVVMGCLVWRVYGENENANFDYMEEQVKYNGLIQNNYDEKLNAKDILPVDQDVEADATTDESELGQDERVAMYEDEAKQQKQFNYFDDEPQDKDQKEEIVDKQPEEKAQDVLTIDPVQKDFYEQYVEDASSEESEGDSPEQEYFGDESEEIDIESEYQSSEESVEDDEGVIYAEDQGDAEIKRAFPNLYDGKSESNSESKDAAVEDYFPTYEANNDKNVKAKPAYNNAQRDADATYAEEEQNNQENYYHPEYANKQGYNADYEVTNDAKDEVYSGTTGKADEGGANPYTFEPFQSALNFKERMDALYSAQLEGMNHRNNIFDGAQFVSQLRQNLLEELTRFRDVFNSVPNLPLVESPPSVEVHEGDNEIVLDASLPGTLRKSIRLELQNQKLILSGTRDRRCPFSYYGSVTFFQSFTVPSGVRSDDIKAQFDDEKQTIQIRIRKPTENRPDPSRIPIN